MPGSIQVSVLGLMEPPPLSSLSLSVTAFMGKREYRTVGGGELSLPVVSLREDLTVIVHDVEGEEILRTEFKTPMLLEQGLWDSLFPLKNGGSLHMKLQFSLSEEDQKRIREMRDAALKRSSLEKPRIRHRRSFSDNKIGCSPTSAIAETVTEGILLDHSEPADPIVEPYLEQREKLPAKRIGEGDASNLSFSQTMPKSFSVGMLSELSSQRQPKLVKDSVFLKKKVQNAVPDMHCETIGNRDFKCDEKIHKLDIGAEESKETKNKSSDTAPTYSEKSGSFMAAIDNDSKATGSGKSTRLAEGILSRRKDFTSVDVEKGPSIIPIIRNFENVREKGNLNLRKKGGGALGSNASSRTLKERPLSHSEGVNRKINKVDADENSNEEQNLRNKPLPSKKKLEDSEKIELSHQHGDLGEVAITWDDDNMSQSPSNEQTAKKHYNRICSAHRYATSSEPINEKTEVDESNKEELSLGDETLPSKEGFSVEVAKTGNNENTLESHSEEEVASGSFYEKAEALKSGCSSICPIGILSSAWTSRHICITTGSKLLREFSESCILSLETNPIESSPMIEADTKQLKDGDSYVQGNESMALPSAVENPPSSLESNGGLIEQGIWIVVMLIACRLLLKAV